MQFTGIATQSFVRDSPWEKKKWEMLPKSAYEAYAWGFFRVHNLPGSCSDPASYDPAECGWYGRTAIQVRICDFQVSCNYMVVNPNIMYEVHIGLGSKLDQAASRDSSQPTPG